MKMAAVDARGKQSCSNRTCRRRNFVGMKERQARRGEQWLDSSAGLASAEKEKAAEQKASVAAGGAVCVVVPIGWREAATVVVRQAWQCKQMLTLLHHIVCQKTPLARQIAAESLFELLLAQCFKMEPSAPDFLTFLCWLPCVQRRVSTLRLRIGTPSNSYSQARPSHSSILHHQRRLLLLSYQNAGQTRLDPQPWRAFPPPCQTMTCSPDVWPQSDCHESGVAESVETLIFLPPIMTVSIQ